MKRPLPPSWRPPAEPVGPLEPKLVQPQGAAERLRRWQELVLAARAYALAEGFKNGGAEVTRIRIKVEAELEGIPVVFGIGGAVLPGWIPAPPADDKAP